MDIEIIATVASAVAAVVATAAAAWSAMSSVTRSARLYKEEALWRQVLELDRPGSAHSSRNRLVRDLHEHALAQIIGSRLAPSGAKAVTAVAFTMGVAFATLTGVLSARIALAIVESDPRDSAWFALILGTFLLAFVSGTLLSGSLTQIAFETTARNAISRQVLQDGYPVTCYGGEDFATFVAYHSSPPRRMRTKAIALGLGATLALAGVAAAVTATLLTDDVLRLWIVAGGLLTYAVGLWSTRYSWRGMIEVTPPFESLSYRVIPAEQSLRTPSPSATPKNESPHAQTEAAAPDVRRTDEHDRPDAPGSPSTENGTQDTATQEWSCAASKQALDLEADRT